MDYRSWRDKIIYLITFFADLQPVPTTSRARLTTKLRNKRSRRCQGFLSESETEKKQDHELKVSIQRQTNDSDKSEDECKFIFL